MKSKNNHLKNVGETPSDDFESYFKIGISTEYILLRNDFPIGKISPGDFKKLLVEMFRRNDEACHEI